MSTTIRRLTSATQGTPLQEIVNEGACEDHGAHLAIVDSREHHVLVTRDNIATPGAMPDFRWHISISRQRALPTWRDFAEIVHEIRPGVPFVLGIPPRSWWINVHEFTLHAFETKDGNLIDQWRAEGAGHTPT